MKKIGLTILINIATTILLFGQIKSTGYTLKGDIKGLVSKNNLVYLGVPRAGKYILDSVPLKDGKFTFKGKHVDPGLVSLSVMSVNSKDKVFYNPYTLVLDNGLLVLTGEYSPDKAFQNIKLEGSSFKKELEAFENSLDKKLIQDFWSARQKKDTVATERARKIVIETNRQKSIAYIEAHPKSFVSLNLFDEIIENSEYDNVLYEKLFSSLDPSIKYSDRGKITRKSMTSMAKKLPVGAIAAEFTQPDLNGKNVNLSDYRGSYVLVDFWASWCGPCREENPKVLKAYNQYKDKGLKVLSVSLDTNEEKWKKAVAEDKLPWTQVSDLKSINSAANTYGITSIPDNFIIDPNGKIVAKNLRGEGLVKKLVELFGQGN